MAEWVIWCTFGKEKLKYVLHKIRKVYNRPATNQEKNNKLYSYLNLSFCFLTLCHVLITINHISMFVSDNKKAIYQISQTNIETGHIQHWQ